MSPRSRSLALPNAAPTDGRGRRRRRLPAGFGAPLAAGPYRATVLSRRYVTAVALVVCLAVGGSLRVGPTDAARDGAGAKTTIRYLVVLFQENVSFDHYFATYPQAENPPGEPVFRAAPRTPAVDNLLRAGLLAPNNPNAAQPFRLARSRAATCSQNHAYWAEQAAADGGAMDLFVPFVGVGSTASWPCRDYGLGRRLVMGYFDGNTVTALWNYAQHFAMSDRFFNTTFGPSTPGALNLISGQTHGASPHSLRLRTGPAVAAGSMVGDGLPRFDDCSTPPSTVAMSGRNVGHLLNARGVTWGWFQGGFARSSAMGGTARCHTAHVASDGTLKEDYLPHHEPFQYYASTANPHHLPPSSVAMIGRTDRANHQYDLRDFWAAAAAGTIPAVSFLKAPAYEDGHAGYSSPLAEQRFIVETLNRLQRLPQWRQMAVIVTYDDSDGWYDHVAGPIVNHSQASVDAAICNRAAPALGAYQGRCGYGPRLPLLVISPFARPNFVDHTLTDQSSILRFVEDNWELGRIGDRSFDEVAGSLLGLFDFDRPEAGKLFLDPDTGLPLPGARPE
ncbi:MAG: phospholipase [Candidatus Rokuibacteriota bacterium]|nr:MAG: phospholipase [Candidatus Rokubacteria bacterium]